MLANDQESDAPLEDPTVVGVLEDIPGGQKNLLRVSALEKPVRVEFPQWYNSEPSEEFPETVTLSMNGERIDCKEFTTHPIPSSERYIDIPSEKFREERNTILYEVMSYTGDPYSSLDYTVTVDTVAPKLAFQSEILIDPLIVQDGLTQDYLDKNGKKFLANIPTYTEPAPGDVIRIKYLKVNTDEYRELCKTLTRENQYDSIQFEILEQLILEMDDGPVSLTCSVSDRAGNLSGESTPVNFNVAVKRAPRVLPFPWVVQATGDYDQYAQLDPQKAVGGATGQIIADAHYYEDDRVWFQFGEVDAFGSARVPVPWGIKEVPIPAASIAAFFNKRVPVYYVLELRDGTTPESAKLDLQVISYPVGRFPPPQLESPFSDPVSKATIPNEGLPVHQRAWPFISRACLITITVSGSLSAGGSDSRIVLNREQVTEPQVSGGVHARLPKNFMTTLAINTPFEVATEVSFNGGVDWIQFNPLRIMLRA